MRIGKYELEILKLLYEDEEGDLSFNKIRKAITGYPSLKWGKLSYDKYYEVDRLYKTLSRATRTLEDKGLIKRRGCESWQGKLSRVRRLEITDKGRNEYLRRVLN